jgi:hypothetical protein
MTPRPSVPVPAAQPVTAPAARIVARTPRPPLARVRQRAPERVAPAGPAAITSQGAGDVAVAPYGLPPFTADAFWPDAPPPVAPAHPATPPRALLAPAPPRPGHHLFASPTQPPVAPPPLTPAHPQPMPATLARSPRLSPAPISLARQAAPVLARSAAGGNAGGGSAGGSDSDAAYHEFLRRVRDEREQLGQLIPHPF